MEVESYKPEDVLINEAVEARRGKPSQAAVRRVMESMVRLRENNQPHQLQNGVVRLVEGNKPGSVAPELVIGRTRLEAERHSAR